MTTTWDALPDTIKTFMTALDASDCTYTTAITGATITETTVDVEQHLEGDFPGGVADLHYRFALNGALVVEP
jgi:hypothetical protein